MVDGPSRSQLALYAVAVLVVVLLGGRYLGAGGGGPGGEPGGAPGGGGAPAVRVERERPAAALVHVAGAVRRPGVYRMPPGARIDDAVRRAGGATRRADLGAVNLAAKVEDGRQVLVPERAPGGTGSGTAGAGGSSGGSAPAGPATGAGPGSAGGAAGDLGASPGVPLNLNSATLEQLDTLPGVGPATAEKILAYRDEHGGFSSVEELGEVPGIGEKRLATLRELVTV